MGIFDMGQKKYSGAVNYSSQIPQDRGLTGKGIPSIFEKY